MRIRVECYSGYKGEETPRQLIIGEQVIGVVKILDQWLPPHHRDLKVEGGDGSMYIVRPDKKSHSWEISIFEERKV